MEVDKRIAQIRIHPEDKILWALKLMDKTNRKLLIVMEKNKFVGLLSIGDIQRGILKSIDLDSSVKLLMRKNIKVANEKMSYEEIKRNMLEYRMECIPVVNDKKELLDIFFWEDVFGLEKKRTTSRLNIPVVIMAGGKGSRLKPLTNILPKPLIPIGEKTVLEEIMDHYVDAGCNRFFISVNYKSEMIRQYFRTLGNPCYKIEFIQEEMPSGTAGSLSLLKNKIDQSFFVSNCDILIDQNLEEILRYHKAQKNEITIVSSLINYSIPYGTLETGSEGTLLSLSEKPELTMQINSGMYLMEPALLDEIPENTFYHITELIQKLIAENRQIGVFPVNQSSWKDIGSWKEYISAAGLNL